MRVLHSVTHPTRDVLTAAAIPPDAALTPGPKPDNTLRHVRGVRGQQCACTVR